MENFNSWRAQSLHCYNASIVHVLGKRVLDLGTSVKHVVFTYALMAVLNVITRDVNTLLLCCCYVV